MVCDCRVPFTYTESLNVLLDSGSYFLFLVKISGLSVGE